MNVVSQFNLKQAENTTLRFTNPFCRLLLTVVKSWCQIQTYLFRIGLIGQSQSIINICYEYTKVRQTNLCWGSQWQN